MHERKLKRGPKGGHLCWWVSQRIINLVEDGTNLLSNPIQWWPLLKSNFWDVWANQRSGRRSLLTGHCDKNKLGGSVRFIVQQFWRTMRWEWPSLLTDRPKTNPTCIVNIRSTDDRQHVITILTLGIRIKCSWLGKVVVTECDTLKLSSGLKYSYCILNIYPVLIFINTRLSGAFKFLCTGVWNFVSSHETSSDHIQCQASTFDVSRTFMAGAASQAGDADSSRAPGLTSGLQGSVNVHRGALL